MRRQQSSEHLLSDAGNAPYVYYVSFTDIRTEYFDKMKQVQVKGTGGKESAYMWNGEWTQQIQNKITVLTCKICALLL